MRLRHDAPVTAVTFDDPNLVSCAGLVPVMRLAEQAGLHDAVADRVSLPTDKGANPAGKVATIVAGMLAGADSIDDLDVARHGGMRSLFTSVYAPSTLGSFLRTFSHGHVRQLQAAARDTLIGLARRAPLLARRAPLLAGADVLTFVDIDSMLRRVYGKQKQGIGFGHAKVGGYNVWLRGYNPLVATLSTPLSAPVVAATRLRAGNAGSARGAARMIAETITTARSCGATGEIVVRADSAFYAKTVISTCRRHKVRFSVTARIDAKIRAACDSISDEQWIDIRYPRAIWDENEQRWISDAQIVETTYTAFAGTRHAVTTRLIVRRIRSDDPHQACGQQELLPAYRYHAVLTDSPFTLVQAEAQHRQHAIIEQVNADLIAGPLAHLPSGRFSANDAWLTCAGIAHNLTRAAGHLAAGTWTAARPATIRTRIISVAARLAHRARAVHLHLPEHWPWQAAFDNLFTAVHPVPG
ncbi:IS1380 family transposase [Plantactinospora sp. S1510]|uniref:IS1380 family transposase n=1 Tax=Plantactinospora alkalitolerans TaxID=2789879 RepID=A0ABS0GV78_9ACTN|nr:IS1380 family transposase [Plantactinospora alkalitolerans]MBF9130114.1 IS1380 family transposase [Plantactinospora alkalitolerans]